MYRSRNSNPSQPNQSPCYWTNMPRLSTLRTQTVQLKRWEACFYKWTHTRKSRNGWDTGSHHPRPCLHLNWLRLPSSSSCPLPPNLPLLSSPPRLNSREVVNLFFLLHQLVSWLPFPTTVNNKVLSCLVGVECITCISASTLKWELPHHKSNPTQHLQ